MKNKRSGGILIIQMALMYLTQLPFVLAILSIMRYEASFEEVEPLLKLGLIDGVCLFPVCAASVALGLIKGLKKKGNPLGITLCVKLLLIPFYIINFVICILLVGGFLNPFLMIALPLLIMIEIGITYVLMISTSIQSFTYILKALPSNHKRANPAIITGLIFLFIFSLDVIGIIMLNSEFKYLMNE